MRPATRYVALGLSAISCAVVLGLLWPSGALNAQNVPITFKYVARPDQPFVRVFLPGDFNNWGPNSNGVIAPGAPSLMTYDDDLDMHLYAWAGLPPGQSAEYKIHLHLNQSGTNGVWLSDPANPVINPANLNNSVVTIADPMIFQMDCRPDGDGNVIEVSAGLFGTSEFSEIAFAVNGDGADGMPHFDAETGIFRFALDQPVGPNPLFELTAVTVAGDTVTGKIGALPVAVEDAPRPAGTIDGINYDPADPSRVVLSLFAPGKQAVHAIGDFNNWEALPGFLMKRDSLDADSVWFWIELTGLTPGREYAFQYLIDGELRTGDPYSTKILDPVNDPNIGSAYPGLKPYPAGETTQIVSVFQTDAPEYEWQTTDYERRPASELVIYELLVRDFVEAHDYTTLIDTLDYLERLGVNAIELMPVAEFSGNSNWGYEPNFVFAPDKYYGPASSLKAFIDECHARGIAVILDVVYNHAAYEAPFSRMYSTSGQGTPGAQPTPDNPWLNPVATHPFNVFNDANHESAATKYWLDRVNTYWLTEFRVDGFRFDLSKGFTQVDSGNDVGAWGRYDASRIAILKRMADVIWAVDSTAYVILEHLSVDSEERELGEYRTDQGRDGMLLWNKMSDQYAEATMGYHSFGRSNLSRVYYGDGGRRWSVPNLVSYMESHDEQWMMFKNLKYGACAASPDGGNGCAGDVAGYNVRHIPTALDRQKMAAAFFFTIPGPKMAWQFGELGYGFGPEGRDCLRPSNQTGDLGECPAGTPIRTGAKPIRWDYYADPARSRLYRTWSELLRLRRDHPVFRSTETEVTMAVGPAVKTVSLRHPELDVAIIGNFAVLDSSGVAPFSSAGVWHEFFSGDSLRVTDVDTLLELKAGEFRLYTNRFVEPAEEGLVTVSSEAGAAPGIPSDRLGLELYPNPSKGRTWVSFELAEAGSVDIVVFDTLGRVVSKTRKDALPRGAHTEPIDVSEMTSGVYFVRFETDGGGRSVVRPLVLQ